MASTTKFKVKKFNGRNDLSLWRVKVKALFVQQGLEDALESRLSTMTVEEEKKWKSLQAKAHSAIILCVGDKVLWEVIHETIFFQAWSKLQSSYMQWSLPNRLYLK